MRYKLIQFLESIMVEEDETSYIILENNRMKVSKATSALVRKYFTENKDVKIAELKVNKTLSYFLEEADSYIFLLRVIKDLEFNYEMEKRVKLNEEDKKLIDKNDYRKSIQLLVNKIEHDEKRFGI